MLKTVRFVVKARKLIRAGTIKNPDGDDGSSRRNDSAAVSLNPGSVVRGSDELRGENVPYRAWRAARSRRNFVHGTHCYLAGTA
jgi:hypothetical protein